MCKSQRRIIMPPKCNMPEKKRFASRAEGERSGRWWSRRALALGLLVIASYLPVLDAGFVWDDVIFVEEPVVHHWSGLWNIWFSPSDIKKEGHYWPVVYTSFWLDHKLWGLNPLGYHVVNLLLHLVNVLLIWRLLGLLAVPGAWIIAAVFAVHPLHVESVAWVIERKDLLSAFFYLAAVLTWIRYARTRRAGQYVLALGLFTAGLLSKSIVVTLPAALLIWHWWQSGRVTRVDLARLAPFFGVALAVTALDLSFYASREPLSLGYSLAERILIAGRALWFYVGKLLWPTDLAVIYPLWDIRSADPVAWAYVLAAAGVVALLWFGRHRLGRGPLAGALFFGVTLSPVLGFVDYGYMQFSLVADRFQYLAGLGVLAVLLGPATHGVSRLPAALRTGAAGGLAVVLALLGMLTWRQAAIYRDPVTFFSHIVALNPEARDAHLNLMGPLSDAGRHEEALTAGRIGVAQRPGNADIHSNLGRVLIRLDRLDEAEAALRTALELTPRHLNANQNLGEALRKQGRHAEAIEAYRKVLEIDDGLVRAYCGLGIALFQTGRYEEAIAPLEKALEMEPDAPFAGEISLYAGRAARNLGRPEAATAHFLRASALTPDSVEALVELSNLLFAQGRTEAAGEYLRRVRELQPGDPSRSSTRRNRSGRRIGMRKRSPFTGKRSVSTRNSWEPTLALGAALFNLKRYEEALETLARAAAPETAAAAHYLAGRSLLELNRTADAAEQFERALQSDPDHAEALDHLAHLRFGQKQYEAALDLYRTQATLKPGSVTVRANIGVTLYFLGRHAEALESMEHVLRLDPDHQMARKMVAQLRQGAQ